nr:non-heme iron oxygenase ferredoxin subunit [Candidatus Sigynarchaeota archaeon]
MEFIQVAKKADLSEGQMIHVEANGQEILLANVGGKIYAVGDRCGHMNASLAGGELEGNIVRCALHKAEFDLATGKNTKPPAVPKLIAASKMGKLMVNTKTHDLPVFEVKAEGDNILVKI